MVNREKNEVVTLKSQITELIKTVSTLAREVQTLKTEHYTPNTPTEETRDVDKPWSDTGRVKKMKASLCIQSNGTEIDMAKVQEIAVQNRIQVSKATTKDNGDVYVELPSEENREKLKPLLNNEAFAAHNVVELKSKLPTISILDVKEFSSKEEFVQKVMNQNEDIKTLVEAGSTFSVVYSKSPPNNTNSEAKKYHQIVARVSEDVQKVIRTNRNRLFADLSSYRVVDRFYVKRCNKCQKFGHYEKYCENEERCGYCMGPHLSTNCQEAPPDNHDLHKCVNCKDSKKDPNKHSVMWYKCPMYVEMQKKLKKSIPFYQKN